MRWNLADQRDVFFFYLAVISYANSTCKVKKGEEVDDSCQADVFISESLTPFKKKLFGDVNKVKKKLKWKSIDLDIY